MSAPLQLQAPSWSPWGTVEVAIPLGPDAVAVITASHGGIFDSGAGLSRIPALLRSTRYSREGWFEEDCDWAIPYLVLDLHRHEEDPAVGERKRLAARRTILTWHAAQAGLLGVTADEPPAGDAT